jgi:hypothetical protein
MTYRCDILPTPRHNTPSHCGRVLSVCTGAFILGAAGLLDGRRCTTHWRNVSDLALCCPAADVDPSVLYVDADPVFTSAGTAAGIDACLYLVRKEHGSKVANAFARRMVARQPCATTSAPGSTRHRTHTGARSAWLAPPRGRHQSAGPARRPSCGGSFSRRRGPSVSGSPGSRGKAAARTGEARRASPGAAAVPAPASACRRSRRA